MADNLALALLLSTLAGLSTIIGSLLGLLFRRPGPRFLSLVLGFSAGVMVLVSFVELLQHGIQTLGFVPAHLAFFGGMGCLLVIDVLAPHRYLAEGASGPSPEWEGGPRHGRSRGRPGDGAPGWGERHRRRAMDNERLLRTGLFVAIGLAIHNFPEGIATFVASMEDIRLGAAIAIAIAIHNIPEGLAISAPIYAATGSRSRAFLWSAISGLAEPLGAVLAAGLLYPFLSDTLLAWILSAVAGIMVFIALDELVPVSFSFGAGHLSIVGVMAGMAVIAFSLWILVP